MGPKLDQLTPALVPGGNLTIMALQDHPDNNTKTTDPNVPEQLNHFKNSLTLKYPALAHKNRPEIMTKNIRDALVNLKIYVTPNDMFEKKLLDIFGPFTKINTKDYLELLDYTKNESPTRNFAVWCATSGCGVAMTHLL